MPGSWPGAGLPRRLCPQLASQRGVRVLVDAEQTYINPALGLVTLALMARWNRDRAWVWNTYQAYLQVPAPSLCPQPPPPAP